jgi:hypothetical protein
MQPETRYAKSGDVHVAYQAFGEGSIDLVFVPGFISNSSIIGTTQAMPAGSTGWPGSPA